MNRLGSATSPYLLQHKDNPVEWFEWGEEAFEQARSRDVPILLSVGYAACHWCHVMAHDSFEREDVAHVMNQHFVNVKVDREERPDVDAVYMQATTALTGQGGWPMTCLLTPDGKPFFAGTFFPRAQFVELLNNVAGLWQTRREEVIGAGQRVVDALSATDGHIPSGGSAPVAAELDAAAAALTKGFDAVNGGFGRAPKFPPSMVLEFLLRHYERTGDAQSLAMAGKTFDAMARGGMYDQLAGGFARYSVDAQWVVPHFEKMLYDNALLLRGYLHWWRLTGSPLAERIARETAEFIVRDLGTTQGGFASALDADTDGVEGLTYVWTPALLGDVLGPEDGPEATDLFTVTLEGTFEEGTSTLQLLHDPKDVERYESIRARLLEARARRPQPARDDKVITSWNGLAIAALAEAGVLLDPAYLVAATKAAETIVGRHLVDGRLRRSSRDGVVGSALAVAEDYGNLADGLLMLHQATGDRSWLTTAGELLDFALAHFGDGEGGFYDTATDAEALVRRPKDPSDNASPAGATSLALALVGYAALTGSSDHRAAAEAALGIVGTFGAREPRFLGWGLAAAEGLVAGPVQVAIVGESRVGESGEAPLTATAWRQRPPGAVIVSGAPDAFGIPLLAGRPLVAGAPTAYVCHGFVCSLPVSEVGALQEQLGR
ncbi:thioredoxin domain-containing protein [Jatrophihabitans sp.]|uniref:thioredoxin domain-containing protein n=1 Tax=Jatrophihabitans sp. TaxID=1932789 RepID=UPI0030C66BFF